MLKVFSSGPFDTNAYVLVSEKDKTACVFDPAPGSAKQIIPFLESNHLQLKCILLTHTHWDHIGDAAELKEKFHVPIYVHAEDRPNLEKPGSDGLPLFFHIRGVIPDKELKDGDRIEVGQYQFTVIHTPGHSGGSVCFYEPKAKLLFSGDTLFQGTIGNLSFPTSNAERMWPSLEKLAKLPKEVKVYPGHGDSTTIGDEAWLSKAKEYFGG